METDLPVLLINNTKMYTPRDFARAKGIPVQTVYSAVREDRIQSERYGGRVYMIASSAETYAEIYKATKGSS